MDTSSSEIIARLIIILGAINLVTGLLIFSSCRCIPGWGFARKLTQHQSYQRFFRYHCYIWRVFWPSVFVHAILAILFIGVPF